MSTNILDELNKMLGGDELPPNTEWQPLELGAYVKKVMHDKRLSLRQVALASDGGITQGYVGGIMNGHYRNLTVDKVKALAKGLGIDDDELFTILRGKPKEAAARPELAYYIRVLDLTKVILSDPQLFELLRLYMELPPTVRESAIKALEILQQGKKRDSVRAM
jgi:transcriptional regulator with XRE-family HTH domain